MVENKVMDNIFKNILDNAKVTIGSQVYGGATVNSDYDFIMNIGQYNTLIGYLERVGISFSETNGSSQNEDPVMFNIGNLKFILDTTEGRKLINVLAYPVDDIPKLVEVNKAMLKIIESPLLANNIAKSKKYRVDIFMTLLITAFDAWDQNENTWETIPDDLENIDLDDMPF